MSMFSHGLDTFKICVSHSFWFKKKKKKNYARKNCRMSEWLAEEPM